ncbi:MAG: sulfite exporter TauE/SafE family protein [Bacteroidota bacterium]
MGFVGSLHCVGMCGPLMMLATGSPNRPSVQGNIRMIGYHSGRILTYSLMGIIAGLIGQSISWVGWQKILTISLGVGIVFLQIHPKYYPLSISKGVQALKKTLKLHQKKPGLLSRFAVGMANGLLPCGLVYLALASSLTTSSLWEAAGFMFIFGLGTLPALITLHLSMNRLSGIPVKRIMRYFSAAVGILLILRGLEWGIPFISPHFPDFIQQAIVICS